MENEQLTRYNQPPQIIKKGMSTGASLVLGISGIIISGIIAGTIIFTSGSKTTRDLNSDEFEVQVNNDDRETTVAAENIVEKPVRVIETKVVCCFRKYSNGNDLVSFSKECADYEREDFSVEATIVPDISCISTENTSCAGVTKIDALKLLAETEWQPEVFVEEMTCENNQWKIPLPLGDECGKNAYININREVTFGEHGCLEGFQ